MTGIYWGLDGCLVVCWILHAWHLWSSPTRGIFSPTYRWGSWDSAPKWWNLHTYLTLACYPLNKHWNRSVGFFSCRQILFWKLMLSSNSLTHKASCWLLYPLGSHKPRGCGWKTVASPSQVSFLPHCILECPQTHGPICSVSSSGVIAMSLGFKERIKNNLQSQRTEKISLPFFLWASWITLLRGLLWW